MRRNAKSCLGLGLCLCVWGWMQMPVAWANSSWETLLKKAYALEKQKPKSSQKQAADLMMQAYRLAPNHLETMVAAAHACMIRASLGANNKEISQWGLQGAKYSEQIIQRWPKRAEGYFWASVNYGHHARGGGVWVALTKGLAGKIERMALKSYKLNPALYKGAAQRVLGRYYFRLPWPMRKVKKSLAFLEDAYRRNPTNASNLFFLAETLWADGQKQRALGYFRQCAKFYLSATTAAHPGERCHKWLRKHGK